MDLSNNYLGPEGAKAIASGIRDNGSMTHLILDGNEIEDEGAVSIGHALADVIVAKKRPFKGRFLAVAQRVA